MAGLRASLVVFLSTATVLVGTASTVPHSAQACPFSKAKPVTTTVQDPGQTPGKPFFSPGNGINQSGVVGGGLATIALLIGGLVYQRRLARQTAPVSADMGSEHPEIAHPELMLTNVPKEALLVEDRDRELTLTR